MAGLDPSILLQARPVDLTSLGESLNPANIYQKGLALRKNRQEVGEQGRQLDQQKALREKAAQFDVSTPEGKQAYLDSIKSDPRTSDKYLEAANAFSEQKQKTAQAGLTQTEADIAGAKTPLIMDYIKRFTNPQSSVVDDPNAPLHQRLLTLKNRVLQDEAAKSFGLPVPPENQIAYNQAVVEAKQGLQAALGSPEWQAKIRAIAPGKTNEAAILEREFYSQHPEYEQLPEELKKTYHDAFVAPQQPTGAYISLTPPNTNDLGAAAKRIANGESTISQEIKNGNFSGATSWQVQNDLVNAVKQINPGFSQAESEAGFNFSAEPSTKRAVQQLDNAYATIDRLKGVYSKLKNTEYPTINKAISAGRLQSGDVDVARAAIAEVLANDELTQAFARGGVGSDKLRDMSTALANKNMSPSQQAAQFDEILHGIARSRKAYETQGAGYIKPANIKTSAPAFPVVTNDAEYAKIQPGSKYTTSDGRVLTKAKK